MKLPTTKPSRPSVPDVFTGKIYENVGKYARGAVLYAFESVGGPEALAQWAQDNPDDFYTKLFPRIITRETEVHHTRSLDELMDVIDVDFEIEEVAPVDAPTLGRSDAGGFGNDDDPADFVRVPDGSDWGFSEHDED